MPLLADRFDGGYGLSGAALARVLGTGATLLVTCDCGSSDHERLERARPAGVDAVVIDHHRVPDVPLPALAFLNPHRPECAFPYKGLASVGLALSIGAGVRAELGVELDMRRWLDLVAHRHHRRRRPSRRRQPPARPRRPRRARAARVPGRARSPQITQARPALTGEDVAFRFAPRINAPGRLAKPDLALALLLATTDAEARRLAEQVD